MFKANQQRRGLIGTLRVPFRLKLGDASLGSGLVDLLAQVNLENLSVRVPRKRVIFEHDEHGDLERGQHGLAVVDQSLGGDPLVQEAGLDLDDGRDDFAENAVGETDDGAVHDGGVGVEHVLDFDRGDL